MTPTPPPTYDPWQSGPQPTSPPSSPPPPPRGRRISPNAIAAVAIAVLVLLGSAAGAAVLLLAGDDKAAEAKADPASEVFDRCKQYNGVKGASIVADTGSIVATERLTKGTGETSGVLDCIQRATDMPTSVMSDIYAANMLMGRQDAEWNGWTLSYDVSNSDAAFELRLNLRVKGTAAQD